jgi:hypothetical protein
VTFCRSLCLRPRDGIRAFFLEMEEQGKTTATIIYDSFNSMLDSTSSNLAELFTGQKTDWSKSFLQIGTSTLPAALKSEMQKGLGSTREAL